MRTNRICNILSRLHTQMLLVTLGSACLFFGFDVSPVRAGTEQPDLLIKKASEGDSAYAIDNEYQTSPSGDQLEMITSAAGEKASFKVKVQNDGDTTRTFSLRAEETEGTGWNITYKSGETDITDDIKSENGWTTPDIAPTESIEIIVDMTSERGVAAGSEKKCKIWVRLSQTDTSIKDAVLAKNYISSGDSRKADLLIKKGSEADSAYAINDVYQTSPSGDQVEVQTLTAPNTKATYNVRVQNDETSSRTFVLKATENEATGWTVVYKSGSSDITSQIRGTTGWTTPSLAAQASHMITVEVTAGTSANPGTSKSVTLKALADSSSTTVLDAVLAYTHLGTSSTGKADLLIKKSTETDSGYALNDVYQQPSPSGYQIKSQSTLAGTKATFYVKVQNDGDSTRTYVVKALESSESSWTIVYKVGTTDITSQIKSQNGRTTASLAKGACEVITIEMTPSTTVAGGSSKSAEIRAYLTSSDTTAQDVVRATTTATVTEPFGRADLLIKKSSESDSAYAINDQYQTNPSSDQIESQSILAGQAATFNVKVQNDNNSARTFVVKAEENVNSDWTVVYRVGTTDVTTQIRGEGRITANLAPGACEIITVTMTATAGARSGSAKYTLIRAYLEASSASVKDAVKAHAYVTSPPEQGDTVVVYGSSLAPPTVTRGQTNVAMEALRLSVSANSAVVTHMRFDESGSSIDASDVARIKVYRDANSNGRFDPATDTLIGSAVPTNQTITIDIADQTLDGSCHCEITLFVVYDIGTNATIGRTVGVQLANAGYVTVAEPDRVSTYHFPIVSGNSEIVGTGGTRPDIYASLSISPDPSIIGRVVTATIVVTRTAATDGFRVDFYRNRTTAPRLNVSGDNVISVPAGTASFTQQIQFQASAPGNLTAWVQVDTEGIIAESNEANNTPSVNYTVQGLTIGGTVRDTAQRPLPGVTVRAESASSSTTVRTAITDAAGNYIISGLTPARWMVTASLDRYVFTPSMQALTLNSDVPNTTGVDFTGTGTDFVASLTISPASAPAGSMFTASIVITRTTTSEGFWVDFYRNRSFAPALRQQGDDYFFVSPGDSVVTRTITFRRDIAGSCNAYLQIDTDNVVNEVSENNNIIGPIRYTVTAITGMDTCLASTNRQQPVCEVEG